MPLENFGCNRPEGVAVSLADMVPLLMHALGNNRSWLSDFAEDVVHVPQDLYEVLVAYRHMVDRETAA